MLAAGALVLGLLLAAPAAANANARVVTSWPFTAPYGSFAESLALGPDGSLYASLTTWGDEADSGQIVAISPSTGAKTPFGESIDVGLGLLTGVAFDQSGNLYVAEAFSDTPGVFRVPANGPPTQVLALPSESFPNGVAFHDGYLYVTDSSLGAVWRSNPSVLSSPSEPWLEDALLMPGSGPRDHGIGANGIAFRGDWLYVSVSDGARIVRAAVLPDGSAGPLEVVLERATLRSADGIAFDASGNLWITTNGPNRGQLLKLGVNRKLELVATQANWLDYPAMPVFGPSGSLFVENGSFELGTPSIVELQ